jgi:predicted PurR-regulated permease PerM
MMDEKKYKSTIQVLIIIGCVLVLMGILFLASIGSLVKQREQLKNELEFYQEESIREGQIIAVSDAVVYVIDTLKEKVIEVDIYHELIHTTIEVGDIAVYGVNYDYTDAGLLGIIKKE